MSDEIALRAKIRQEVIEELRNLVGLAGSVNAGTSHVLILSDYEVANLRSAIQACGYASVFRSPLEVLQTGDWMGMIAHKLSPLATGTVPNAQPDDLAKRATDWLHPRSAGGA